MRLVLDTSIFGNPESYNEFAENRAEAALQILKKLKSLGFEIYTVPGVVKELELFINSSELEGLWIVKAPNLNTSIPAYVLSNYISELRKRFDKALRIAEEYTRKGITDEKDDIKSLRAKFRELVRNGILDSVTDLYVVLLALELDAIIISSDEGLIKFAELMGCKIINGKNLDKFIANYE